MLEDLAELVIGPWGLATVALFAASRTDEGRNVMRQATRSAVKAWLTISEKSGDLFAEFKEDASDLIAEVKAERQELTGNKSHKTRAKTKA